MPELLDRAIERARALPQRVHELSPDELAELSPSLAQAEASIFASEPEVRALWAKYGS